MDKKIETTQNPDSQSDAQQNTSLQKINIWMIISIILITAIVAGGLVYFLLTSKKASTTSTQALPTPTTQFVGPTLLTASSSSPSSITSLDASWNKYTNYQLGLSLKVPKQMIEFHGLCSYNDKNGDHSYRPQEAAVPVKILEDKEMVYIAAEYNYELSGETKDDTGRTFYSKCDKVTNTVARLSDRENYHSSQWQIVVKEIENDTELEQFLKNRYGEGCSLGAKTVSKQSGVFDIEILGDGLSLGETKCPINYATKVLYYPNKKKVAAWDLGQACSFYYPTIETCLDTQISDSFTFE